MGEEQAASGLTTEPVVIKDVPEETASSAPPQVPAAETKAKTDDSKALVVVEAVKKEAIAESVPEKNSSMDRDTELARLHEEKRAALVKAWEENETAKAENKYHKAVANIVAWEATKKSKSETKLRKAEETLEKKKAAYVEKMKNEIAIIHKAAEEKKALAEVKRGEEILKAEERAAKHRASGIVPKKFCACFSA